MTRPRLGRLPPAESVADAAPSASLPLARDEGKGAAPASPGTTGYLIRDQRPVGPTGGGPGGQPSRVGRCIS